MNSSLPTNKFPIFEITLPVSNTILKYRPWTSLEHKKILTASLSKDNIEIYEAIFSVLTATVFDQVDLKTIPLVDVEYLFTQVKSKSKSDIIELSYQATVEKDGVFEVIPIELHLSLIEVTPTPEKTIHLFENVGVKMKVPSYEDSLLINATKNEFEKIAYLIEFIYNDKKLFSPPSVPIEEITKWLENLLDSQLDKIIEFTSNLPKIKSVISFVVNTNPPTEKTIVLEGLSDFFL